MANDDQAGAPQSRSTSVGLDEESCLRRTRCRVEVVLDEIESQAGDFHGGERQVAKWAKCGLDLVSRVDRATSKLWAESDKTWWSWNRPTYAAAKVVADSGGSSPAPSRGAGGRGRRLDNGMYI